MFKLLFIFLLFPAFMTAQKYSLVWAEEFNNSEIDTETWNFEKGFSKNNEQQFYTSRSQNVRIENGILILEAHKEQYGEEAQYTSARINTLQKIQFRYGKIEIRAKLPKGNGTWPAIWMLGTNHLTEGFPACGEIDIMEFVGKEPNVIYGSLHFPETDNEKLNSVSENVEVPNVSTQFHVYKIEWNGSKIAYFVDDKEYLKFNVDDANRSGRSNIYRKPFYLILNLALGGKWAGEIDDSIFPAQFRIDYIRYYQLQDK